jgi:uncharacterized protein (DUF3084 family)
MLPFALQVALLILVLGGAIAYIGNYVGKYVGKRRLTIFHLRPRHTAIAITIISGILIALTTTGVLLMVSQDARTAVLGLDKLRRQINDKTQELRATNEALTKLDQELEQKTLQLQAAKNEVGSLQRAKESLKKEVKTAREGQVVFRVGEVISLSLIQAGPERDKLEAGLKQIISAVKVEVSSEDLERAVSALADKDSRYVVKLIAGRNVLWGEKVPARIELAGNKLIYSSGGEIAALEIPAGLSAAQIEQQIMKLLRGSHNSAREAGVLPDPSGSLGSVPYSEISELAKKIKANNKDVYLKVAADRDIYAIGPLSIRFKISYK